MSRETEPAGPPAKGMRAAKLVDIGVNLCDQSFSNDRAEVMERAREAGVSILVITGTTLAGSEEAANLAGQHGGDLWSTAGIHPHHASTFDNESIDALRRLAGRPEVVAIGECGLDYNRNHSTPADQRRCFDAQVGLACELKLPLFLHERDAVDEQCEILALHREHLPRAVAHCFTGDAKALRRYLDLDLYIGITGWICDERRGIHLRDLLRTIPSNRLMLESDAPYLLPRTLVPKPKSRRNEPCHLPHVLSMVAKSLKKSEEEVAKTTTATALEFFGLAQGHP